MSTASDAYAELMRRNALQPEPKPQQAVPEDDGGDLWMDSDGRIYAGEPHKRVEVDRAPRRLID